MSRRQAQTLTRASERLQPALSVLSRLRAALVGLKGDRAAEAAELAGELAELLLNVEDLVGVSTPASLFETANPYDADPPRLAGSTAAELFAGARAAGAAERAEAAAAGDDGTPPSILGLPISSDLHLNDASETLDDYSTADLIAMLNRLATEHHGDKLATGEAWDFGDAEVRQLRSWAREVCGGGDDQEETAESMVEDWLATECRWD